MKVHGLVLHLDPKDEQRIKNKIKRDYKSPDNLRKNVNLHMSLTIASFDNSIVPEVVTILDTEFQAEKRVIFKFGHVKKLSDRYIALPIKSKLLHDLHNKLLDKLAVNLKNSFNPKYLDYDLGRKQEKYLYKYGYHRVKEFFDPHITIGKYKDSKIRDEHFNKKIVIDGSYQFTKLVLDEADDSFNEPTKILWETELL